MALNTNKDSLSHELSVPHTRLSTYDDQSFPVAAVQIWNSLPHQGPDLQRILRFILRLSQVLW